MIIRVCSFLPRSVFSVAGRCACHRASKADGSRDHDVEDESREASASAQKPSNAGSGVSRATTVEVMIKRGAGQDL